MLRAATCATPHRRFDKEQGWKSVSYHMRTFLIISSAAVLLCEGGAREVLGAVCNAEVEAATAEAGSVDGEKMRRI